MTSIIISGRPNSELTSQCILLSEELIKYYPSVKFVKVLKHPDEWNNYSEEICKLFGFEKNYHPLIYYSNGEMIGDKEAFFAFVKKNFYLNDFEPNHLIIYNLTQENIKKVNNEYNTRIKGKVLREKVDYMVEKLEFNDDYNTLNYDYELHYEQGMKIFYKYDEKFTPKKYEIFLEPLEENSFEVDLKTNKIIEKERETSQINNISLMNASKEVIAVNTSTQNLNNSHIRKEKEKEKNDSLIKKDEGDEDNEQVEEDETSIKRKTYVYYTYRAFPIPRVLFNREYIVENNVSFRFFNFTFFLIFLISLDLTIHSYSLHAIYSTQSLL